MKWKRFGFFSRNKSFCLVHFFLEPSLSKNLRKRTRRCRTNRKTRWRYLNWIKFKWKKFSFCELWTSNWIMNNNNNEKSPNNNNRTKQNVMTENFWNRFFSCSLRFMPGNSLLSISTEWASLSIWFWWMKKN